MFFLNRTLFFIKKIFFSEAQIYHGDYRKLLEFDGQIVRYGGTNIKITVEDNAVLICVYRPSVGWLLNYWGISGYLIIEPDLSQSTYMKVTSKFNFFTKIYVLIHIMAYLMTNAVAIFFVLSGFVTSTMNYSIYLPAIGAICVTIIHLRFTIYNVESYVKDRQVLIEFIQEKAPECTEIVFT